MASSSHLVRKIARDLASAIAAREFEVGKHLGAQELADRFGVSRSPIRHALHLLRAQGIVEQKANRGFFVGSAALNGSAGEAGGAHPFDEQSPYQRIAADWLVDRLPAEVTEQMLRSRYDLTRAQLADILLRAAREGWAERKAGYGWRFLPVAKTPEAFAQIYRFRTLIEPAAMLEPTFTIDRAVLDEHRSIQQRMLDTDIAQLNGEKLLDIGALFHEALIRFSGNPFFHQSLVRVNRMRRLLEYRSRVDRHRLHTQCSQHLEIISLLQRGDVAEASYLMRRHLGGALAEKLPIVTPPTAADTDAGTDAPDVRQITPSAET